jgi:signal transduction histidine kinase
VKLTILYRVAQEALTNVARHAQASKVQIIIRKEAKCVIMEVIDNGCSFQVEEVLSARESKCLGILGMRERVEMVGGKLSIESTPETGTKIIVRIPISNSNEKKWQQEPIKPKAKKP